MMSSPGKLTIWLTAVRPFAYSASVSAVLLGTAIAFYEGIAIDWIRFVFTLAGVICFHTAANLLNDRYDFERGLDREVLPMSGAVVRRWLTPVQVSRAAAVLLILGMLIGLFLFRQTGWPVLVLGLAGTLLVLGYTRSGVCLKYAALGDLTIFISFGLLPVFGAFWVQAQRFSLMPVLWSIPLAAYTVAILHANNWHDRQTDPEKGCRTVASVLGEKGSAVYYQFLVLGPHAWIVIAVTAGFVFRPFQTGPYSLVLCLLVLPRAIHLSRINRSSQPASFQMLDGLTARMQTGFGSLLTAAFLIGRYLPCVV